MFKVSRLDFYKEASSDSDDTISQSDAPHVSVNPVLSLADYGSLFYTIISVTRRSFGTGTAYRGSLLKSPPGWRAESIGRVSWNRTPI